MSDTTIDINVDVCIIGAGIAGYYIATQCLDKNLNFILIDKSLQPNSKIQTCYIESTQLECGASVFLDTQHELFSLIKRHNLQDKCIPLTSSTSSIKYKHFSLEDSKEMAKHVKY